MEPQSIDFNPEDQRKVLILGGDDAATIGCCNSLRQFGFDGDVNVIKEGTYHYPYRSELLHKFIMNFHINDMSGDKKKKTKDGLTPHLFITEEKTDAFIDKQW